MSITAGLVNTVILLEYAKAMYLIPLLFVQMDNAVFNVIQATSFPMVNVFHVQQDLMKIVNVLQASI